MAALVQHIVFLAAVATVCGASSLNTTGDDDRTLKDEHCYELVDKMLSRRGMYMAPSNNLAEPVQVSLIANLFGVQEVIERQSRIQLLSGFTFTWPDPRISWRSSECEWGKTFVYPLTRIWFPAIILTNGFEETIDPTLWEKVPAVVYQNGNVMWGTGKRYDLTCDLSMADFPVDTQECSINILIMDNVNVTILYDGLYYDDTLTENEIWKVIGTRSATKTLIHGYTEIALYFTIERQITYYIFSLILPTLVLTPLPSITFVLPADCGEKLSVALTTLLTYFVMSLSFFDGIPTTDNLPQLAKIFLFEMIMSALASFIAALLVRRADYITKTATNAIDEDTTNPGKPKISAAKRFLEHLKDPEYCNNVALVFYVLTTFLIPNLLIVIVVFSK